MADLRLRFLGTGTSQGVPVVACECPVCTGSDPRDHRLRSSALLSVDDRHVLIDAGPDLRQQLLRARVKAIHAVVLTHEHMDHVAGIDELRALNYHMKQPMDIHANAGTITAVRRMFHYAFGPDRYPGVPDLRLHIIEEDGFNAGGIDLQAITVNHGQLPVLGFRLGPLAYLTDVKTIARDQMDRLKGLDTLVINALRVAPHPTHLNLAEAIDLVRELAPRRALFTHISHLLGAHADVANALPSGMELAFDGLEVRLES